jgi:hypothetical protein
VTVASAMRIDIISLFGPRVGDEDPAATRIPLVPGGEIAIHGFSDLAFSNLTHVPAPFVRGKPLLG